MTARVTRAGLDFEGMFRTGPAATVIVLPDTPHYHITDLNEAFLTATRKRRDELLGRPLFEALPTEPDDPTATGLMHVRHSLDTVVRTRRPHTIAALRYDLPAPDGTLERHYWKLVSAPLLDANDQVTHIVHRIEDVTAYQMLAAERTRAEAERERLGRMEAAAMSRAQTAERRLQGIFQQAPVAIALLTGPDHVFEFANSRYLELVGRREVLGKPIAAALPELQGQGVVELLDQVLATGRAYHGPEPVVRLARSGTPDQKAFFNFVYQPLLDEHGNTESIAVVAPDVSELVSSREEARAAAAARDAERRQLLAVLEQSPLGIAIAEAPSGRLLFANARAEEIGGRTHLSESIAAYSQDWRGYHRGGRAIEPEEWPLARAILHGETIEDEVAWIEHPKGHRVEITIKAAPIRNAEGKIIAGVAVFWDVTAERRTERQLREAQRLQAVGTLAGGVAHEVNNQMTAVLGFGEFVLRALGANHLQAADMRQVLQAAERAARVTQQLLAFSRQQVNQPRVLDLHALATGLSPVLTQLLGSDKTLVISPTRASNRVNVDPTHVEQVLINLVANARDATPTDGRVTISVEDVQVGHGPVAGESATMAPGPYVLLTIADTGAGIDPETIPRIFEPFFTTKPVGQGTGLGLSMVYGIVKQHGGYIWPHSRPGHGTEMRLYWPAVAAAAAASAHDAGAAESRPLRRAARVLVVEDEGAVRHLAVRCLESVGFTVLAAKDGGEALQLLRGGSELPDILLTDVVMPYVSGRQLSEAATEARPGLSVLFISGYAGDDVIRRGLIPEGAAFLQKPFTPGELINAVTGLLTLRSG